MTGDGSGRNNPLSPYYPSETPSLSGNGRTWFAVLMVVMFLLSAVYTVVSLVLHAL